MNNTELLKELRKAEKEGNNKKVKTFEYAILENRDKQKTGFFSKLILFLTGVVMGAYSISNYFDEQNKAWIYLACFGAIISIYALFKN